MGGRIQGDLHTPSVSIRAKRVSIHSSQSDLQGDMSFSTVTLVLTLFIIPLQSLSVIAF